MTIETIDNVQYYVWRAGDELPKYRPINIESKSVIIKNGKEDFKWYPTTHFMADWLSCDRRWPKLLNDRAQHQRMIDEAFETALDHDLYAYIQRHNQLSYMHTQSGNKEYALDHLAKAGAYVKRMMEYVQEQIDKEVAE